MRAALLLVLASTLPCPAQAPPREAVQARNGMVVCVSPPAAEVGVAVLRRGGNAVDAAIAVAFAEAVTWPEAGNIGGGGFMLVWPGHGKEPVVIDYRETAPAAATADMFAKGIDYQSLKVAGVPGTVRGLGLAHQRFGKLPWKDLVLPAVKLTEEGWDAEGLIDVYGRCGKKESPAVFTGSVDWKKYPPVVRTGGPDNRRFLSGNYLSGE